MVPNFLGTEFRILDHRIDPRDSSLMEYVEDKGRNEIGAVAYNLNVMGRYAATSTLYGEKMTRLPHAVLVTYGKSLQ